MSLRTPLCDLLQIDVPIVQASIGPWSTPQLAAAVSNAGAIGSQGTALVPPQRNREQVRRIRELTDRPFTFIVNHTARPLSEEAFAVTLEERPPAISYALGDPGELVSRAHDAGIRFLQQMHTVEQAERAAGRGVDAVIAQGSEAGGFCGDVEALALVPQVVDAVTPVPVLAAGGIADGRGIAAVLLLGAQGVNLGMRFLAADEAGIAEGWKRRILEATSQGCGSRRVRGRGLSARDRRGIRHPTARPPDAVRGRVERAPLGDRPRGRTPERRARRLRPREPRARARAVHRTDGRDDPRRPPSGRDRRQAGVRGGGGAPQPAPARRLKPP